MAKLVPASGPLHLQGPLPGVLSPGFLNCELHRPSDLSSNATSSEKTTSQLQPLVFSRTVPCLFLWWPLPQSVIMIFVSSLSIELPSLP